MAAETFRSNTEGNVIVGGWGWQLGNPPISPNVTNWEAPGIICPRWDTVEVPSTIYEVFFPRNKASRSNYRFIGTMNSDNHVTWQLWISTSEIQNVKLWMKRDISNKCTLWTLNPDTNKSTVKMTKHLWGNRKHLNTDSTFKNTGFPHKELYSIFCDKS